MVVHPLLIPPRSLLCQTDSSQATLRHPETSIYRCFLPDLTGFIALRRARPNLQHRPDKTVPRGKRPREGIQPRYSGLRVQGTAGSPPSTTNWMLAESAVSCQGEKGNCGGCSHPHPNPLPSRERGTEIVAYAPGFNLGYCVMRYFSWGGYQPHQPSQPHWVHRIAVATMP